MNTSYNTYKKDEQENRIKVSVVIPMYNCEEFVPELLNMFSEQSFTDFEVICVIDGATDGTKEEVRKYCKTDVRFKYVVRENGGAGAARNSGIDVAKGKYIIFPDADDLYKKDYLLKLYEAIRAQNADMAVCDFTVFDHIANENRNIGSFNKKIFKEGEVYSAKKEKRILRKISIQIAANMFRIEFIKKHKLRFSETQASNDVFFSKATLVSAESIVFTHSNLITIRRHINRMSISSKRGKYSHIALNELRKIYDWLEEYDLLATFINDYLWLFDVTVNYEIKNGVNNIFAEELARILNNDDPWKNFNNDQIKIILTRTLGNAGFEQINSPEGREKTDESEQLQLRNRVAESRNENKRRMQELIKKVIYEKYNRNIDQNDSMVIYREPVNKKNNKKNGSKYPGISVILPMYNCAGSVKDVLSMFSAQSFTDSEVICVIDGGTDNTEELVKIYCETDKRFTCINKKHEGYGAARNTGIEIARGEYIIFCDVEDGYTPDYLNRLYEAIVRDDADVSVCCFDRYERETDNSDRVCGFNTDELYENIVYSHKGIDNLFETIESNISNRLYNAAFIKDNGLIFSETMISNDILFACKSISVAERIVFVCDALYTERKHTDPDSINKKRMRHLHEKVFVLCELYNWLKDRSLTEIHGQDYMRLVDHILYIESARKVTPRFISEFAHMLNMEVPWKTMRSGEIIEHLKRGLLTIDDNRMHTTRLLRQVSLERYGRDFEHAYSFPKIKTQDHNTKISVIIPVYNVHDHINKCIESLKAQTLKEIEFIFVDDCSTDGSMEEVEQWAEIDKRVKILHNEKNMGAGISRNRGIKVAHGSYLAFADPDDYMSAGFYELLYLKASDGDHDVVKGSIVEVKNHGINVKNDKLNENIMKSLGKRPLYYLFRYEHWSAIYSSRLFEGNKINYGITRCSEESLFLLGIGYLTEDIVFEIEAVYYYVERKGSLYGTYTKDRFLADADSVNEKVSFLLENDLLNSDSYSYIAGKAHVYWMNLMKALAANAGLESFRYEYECRLLRAIDRLPDKKGKNLKEENIYRRAIIEYGALLPIMSQIPETGKKEAITMWVEFIADNSVTDKDYLKTFVKTIAEYMDSTYSSDNKSDIADREIFLQNEMGKLSLEQLLFVENELSTNYKNVISREVIIGKLCYRKDYLRLAETLSEPLYNYYAKGRSVIKLPHRINVSYGDEISDLESFAIPLWALASVSEGDDLIRERIIKMIISGTEPTDLGYWGEFEENSQIIVEIPSIAWFLFVQREFLKKRLSDDERRKIVTWMQILNKVNKKENNWLFFTIIVNAVLHEINWGGDYSLILKSWSILESHYLGDGWYSDGKTKRKDYYNAFGYHFYSLLWIHIDSEIPADIKRIIVQRAEKFAECFRLFFDDSGEAIPYGRSLTYRFAQVAFWSAYKLAGLTGVSDREVKGYINRNIKWWIKKDIFHPEGLFNVGYAYENLNCKDPYNATGSPYWAFKLFVLLQLDERDSFWSETEARPQKTHLNIQKFFKGADYFVTRDKGMSFLFPTDCKCNFKGWKGVQKYEKYVYATGFGFCVPTGTDFHEMGADSSLCISEDGENWIIKHDTEDIVDCEDGYRSIWKLNDKVMIDTHIIINKAWHFRIHNIKTDISLHWRDCGFCVPTVKETEVKNDIELKPLKNGKKLFTVKGIEKNLYSSVVNFEGSGQASVYEASHKSNIIYPYVMVPYIGGMLLPGEHRIVNAFYGGYESPKEVGVRPNNIWNKFTQDITFWRETMNTTDKRKIPKVFIADIKNAGDQFNYCLLEYFGVKAEPVQISSKSDLLMLGGALSGLQNIKKPLSEEPLHVWGSGFLFGDDIHDPVCRPNIVVHALRGKLSKEKLSGLLGKDLPEDLPLADPGLLASCVITDNPQKKYKIGFIPHFREHGTKEVEYILANNKNMHFIDITKDCREVIRELQACESIISSSLHGLIFADSLHIPNLHARITELPKGGTFKYRDYYSSFGLEDIALSLEEIVGISFETIKERYLINADDVEEKKRQLIASFPREIFKNDKRNIRTYIVKIPPERTLFCNAKLLRKRFHIRREQTQLSEKQVIIRQGSSECFKERPMLVSWTVTSHCNYRCSYCFNAGTKYKKIFCTLEQANTTIKHIASTNLPSYYVILTGGEATTHPHLHEIIRMLCQQLGDRLETLQITSNGTFSESQMGAILEASKQVNVKLLISIHLEYTDAEHVAELVKKYSPCTQLQLSLMFHPEMVDKAMSVANVLCDLSEDYPFEAQVSLLREAPKFDKFDSRYTQEHYKIAEKIQEKFRRTKTEHSGLFENQQDDIDWDYMLERDINGSIETLEHISRSDLMKLTGNNFMGMNCCAGTNVIYIKPDGKVKGLICPLDQPVCNIFEENPFLREDWIHSVSCTKKMCGCYVNFRVPKFRSKVCAEKFIAEKKLEQKKLLSEQQHDTQA